jgi:two-component system chemotaxis response regulator CheB
VNQSANRGPAGHFPIVCIGGSVGGLDAFSRLFDNLPADAGCAFVVINHVRNAKRNLLPDILATRTRIPVREIAHGMSVEPNTVFVIPSRCDVRIRGHRFELDDLEKPSGWPNVITIFLESLAGHWRSACVAVIMSGLDSDGVAALKEIKKAGGITVAQAPDSAIANDMPRNAIASGEVDYVLPPEEIGALLGNICRNGSERSH